MSGLICKCSRWTCVCVCMCVFSRVLRSLQAELFILHKPKKPTCSHSSLHISMSCFFHSTAKSFSSGERKEGEKGEFKNLHVCCCLEFAISALFPPDILLMERPSEMLIITKTHPPPFILLTWQSVEMRKSKK